MPVDPKLLEILRCPVTKQPLSLLGADRLARLNARIAEGEVTHHDGTPVAAAVDAALITENGKTLYKIEDDIPIMLEDLSIDADFD
jgi:uncharacterized protein